jgi:hypothetical protein
MVSAPGKVSWHPDPHPEAVKLISVRDIELRELLGVN